MVNLVIQVGVVDDLLKDLKSASLQNMYIGLYSTDMYRYVQNIVVWLATSLLSCDLGSYEGKTKPVHVAKQTQRHVNVILDNISARWWKEVNPIKSILCNRCGIGFLDLWGFGVPEFFFVFPTTFRCHVAPKTKSSGKIARYILQQLEEWHWFCFFPSFLEFNLWNS